MKLPIALSRKQIIAQKALHLFAERGYERVSTVLLAKEAPVSEALIFKRFGTKEQLLVSIITTGYQRIVEHIRGRLAEQDPLVFLHKMIDLPLELVQEEPDFWKLQARLSEVEFARRQHAHFLQPLPGLLQRAFEGLGYAQPKLEAQLLLLLVETFWLLQATGFGQATPKFLEFIKSKYQYQHRP
ncbi:helix-turn-helix domain-containing protein [Hymenobacter sp. BT770]|uniref:TetR/AcrR family transcriptional regulator n=1 Tax=Hymenobacter sp. BT770 TaxID=2886942 RepID=UPI001D0F7CE7|nr:TetR/AcrR family transcriptional regulator [Hymenobacter sp. BT770]MCC3153194.1 TetR/AcrR family transcriptional regulator [Hymenobacter sp. BT770]MDO3415332.1 helix-turn-helix domain-containing protein [Hymenobacter sp. BT770]